MVLELMAAVGEPHSRRPSTGVLEHQNDQKGVVRTCYRCGCCRWLVCLLLYMFLRCLNKQYRIDTQNGSKADSVKISRGIFGAMVGIDRLLNLCRRYNIKASWFVPAHTLETFPKQIAKIRDYGHEM